MKTFTLSSEGVLARYDYLSRLSPDRWAWEYGAIPTSDAMQRRGRTTMYLK